MTIPVEEKPRLRRSGLRRNTSMTMMEIEGIGNLPLDLVIEILSRLPGKVLCKFRCVSKQWLDLLTYDDHFIARHTQQSKKNPILLFRKYSSSETKVERDDMVIVELTGTDMPGRVVTKINAPVGGPVNTFTSSGSLIVLCCPYRVYVCNPGSQEFARVPLSSTMSRYCTVGFGYCRLANEYKIVHLFPSDPFVGDDEGMRCEIFSLKNGRNVDLGVWRRTADCPYKVQTHGLSVCVSGCLYWTVSDEANDLNNKAILSFDLEREEFEVISYPKCYSAYEHNSLFLTGYKNCLCLVDGSSRTSVTDIWLLKDRRRKIWVKEHTFNLSKLGATEIRGVVPCNDDDGKIVFNTQQQGLIEYNMETKGFRKIKTESEELYKLPCVYYDGFFSLYI